VLLVFRRVVEPEEQDTKVVDPENFRHQPGERAVPLFWRRLLHEFRNERQVAVPKLLRTMTECAQMRSRIEGVNKCSANEAFVWREVFQLTVDKREEFFFERRFSQSRIIAHGGDRVIDFLFKEEERDVFLGPEVIKDGAFGDAGFASDCFGSGGVEAFGLEQTEGGLYDAVADGLLILRAFSGDALFGAGGGSGGLCCRGPGSDS
jgi:hypothetical protein